MTSPRPPQRLRSPIDAVHAIPNSLGFTPESSLVVVTLTGAREIGLVARVDLAAMEAPEQWLDGLRRAIRNCAPRGSLILCAYTQSGGEAVAIEALHALMPLVTGARHPISYRILVSGDRFRVLDETPESWHSVTHSRLPRRHSLVDELAPADKSDRTHVEVLVRQASPVTDDGRDVAIAHALDVMNATSASPDDLALLLVGLRDVRVRDTVLWDVMHQRPRTWSRVAESLARAVRLAPATHAAPAATLLSILRWQMGDGTRAVIALERALEAEPDYSLAHLIDAAIAGGLHPYIWREGLADLSREACRGREIPSRTWVSGRV